MRASVGFATSEDDPELAPEERFSRSWKPFLTVLRMLDPDTLYARIDGVDIDGRFT